MTSTFQRIKTELQLATLAARNGEFIPTMDDAQKEDPVQDIVRQWNNLPINSRWNNRYEFQDYFELGRSIENLSIVQFRRLANYTLGKRRTIALKIYQLFKHTPEAIPYFNLSITYVAHQKIPLLRRIANEVNEENPRFTLEELEEWLNPSLSWPLETLPETESSAAELTDEYPDDNLPQ